MSRDLAQNFCHWGHIAFKEQIPQREFSVQELAQEALKNISKHFLFVGITEYFEQSLFMLFQKMGFTHLPPWKRAMATPKTPNLIQQGETLRTLTERFLFSDMQVYSTLKRYFESEFNKTNFGPDLVSYHEHCSTLELQLT